MCVGRVRAAVTPATGRSVAAPTLATRSTTSSRTAWGTFDAIIDAERNRRPMRLLGSTAQQPRRDRVAVISARSQSYVGLPGVMTHRGLQILQRRHPGVELLVRALPNGPDGWHAVEAYDKAKGAARSCYHWYVVSPDGRVWCSPDGERRTDERRTAVAR